MDGRAFDLRFSDAVAGVDEAGRGPLAGPVVVCAIVMPLCPERLVEGVKDSKQLSEKKRERLYESIVLTATELATAVVDNEIIDEINILNAVKRGMTDCINRLHTPLHALVDYVRLDGVKIPYTPITKGDELSSSIACASIIAKVTRDRIMREYDVLYPLYGFNGHKGYGTAKHLEAIERYGACPIHRKTFLRRVAIGGLERAAK